MIRELAALALFGVLSCPAATLTREGWAVTQIDQLRAEDQTITFVAKDDTSISQIILEFSSILHRDIILKKSAVDTKVTVRVHGQAIECFEEILNLGGYVLRENGSTLVVSPESDQRLRIETHFIHGYRLSKTGDTRPSIAAVLDSCRNILRIQSDSENEILDPYGEVIGWQAGPHIEDPRITYNSEEASLTIQGTSSQHDAVENLVTVLGRESTAFTLQIDGMKPEVLRARERVRISENTAIVAPAETQEWVLEKVGAVWIPKNQVAPKMVYPGSSILLWLDEIGRAHLRTENVVASSVNGQFKKTLTPETVIPLVSGAPTLLSLGASKLTLDVRPAVPEKLAVEDLAGLRGDIDQFPRR